MTFFVGDQRIEARAGDFVFAPKGVPHAFLVLSDRAEYLASFSPAGAERFFAEVAPRVVTGETPPAPTQPDPAEFATVRRRTGSRSWGRHPRSIERLYAPAGTTFWFSRKRFVGSYRRLTRASRAWFGP